MNDLIQKAKDAINRFNDLVHNSIANSNKHLKEKIEAIKAKADKVLAETKVKIQEEVQKVKERIDQVKREAAVLGVDVTICLIDHEKDLEQIPLDMIQKLIECVKAEVEKAIDIIKSGIDEIMQIKDQLVGLPGELKACLTNSKPVQCISDLIGGIVNKIAQVPADIQQKINEIMELVQNIEADLTKCAISKVVEVGKEAAAVGVKVAKCVAEEIQKE